MQRKYEGNRKPVEPFKPIPFRRRRAPCPVPKSTFTTFMDEGGMHFRAGHYEKALTCYDRAIELKPTDKGALVARSQCHLRMGEALYALRDAEATFNNDNEQMVSATGVYQFGDALFNLGFFERALIVFTRGRRLRGDMDIFRLAIQKSIYAIQTAILDKSATQIEDYEKIEGRIKAELDHINDQVKKKQCCIRPDGKAVIFEQKIGKPNVTRARWITHQTLGGLSNDKDYLTAFIKRPDIQKKDVPTGQLRKKASEALKVLQIREKLWRQLNPMYMRQKGLNFNYNMVREFEAQEHDRREGIRKVKMEAAEGSILKHIATIDHDLKIGRPDDCRLQCERVLRQMKKLSPYVCPRKAEFMCRIHHYKGLALMKLKAYEECVGTFQAEYEVAVANNMPDFKKQAMDYLGRTHVYRRSFTEAADVWESQVSSAKTPLEKTYLFHELGRCYIEAGKYEIAKACALRCVDEATKINDNVWTMNGRVLLGHIFIKLFDLKQAKENFELAAESAAKWGHAANTKALQELVFGMGVWIEKAENNSESDTVLVQFRAKRDTSVLSTNASISDEGSEAGKGMKTKKKHDEDVEDDVDQDHDYD